MVQLRDIIQLHVACIAKMRRPGIEPGAYGWEPYMLPLHQRRLQSIELAYRSPMKTIQYRMIHGVFKIWRIGVSIPVPRACKARTLPIELIPHTLRGTRAPARPASVPTGSLGEPKTKQATLAGLEPATA